MRCPNCEELGHPFRDFKPLHLVDRYRRELNPIYKHLVRRGGCGHVFSPGDPWIVEAYLAGDLIPKEQLDQAMDLIEHLRKEIAALRNGSDNLPDNAERRVGT
jgi:hypothetical protein